MFRWSTLTLYARPTASSPKLKRSRERKLTHLSQVLFFLVCRFLHVVVNAYLLPTAPCLAAMVPASRDDELRRGRVEGESGERGESGEVRARVRWVVRVAESTVEVVLRLSEGCGGMTGARVASRCEGQSWLSELAFEQSSGCPHNRVEQGVMWEP